MHECTSWFCSISLHPENHSLLQSCSGCCGGENCCVTNGATGCCYCCCRVVDVVVGYYRACEMGIEYMPKLRRREIMLIKWRITLRFYRTQVFKLPNFGKRYVRERRKLFILLSILKFLFFNILFEIPTN